MNVVPTPLNATTGRFLFLIRISDLGRGFEMLTRGLGEAYDAGYPSYMMMVTQWPPDQNGICRDGSCVGLRCSIRGLGQ